MKVIKSKYIKFLFMLICIFLMGYKVNAEEIICKYKIDSAFGLPYSTLTVGYDSTGNSLDREFVAEGIYREYPYYYQFDNGNKYWNETTTASKLRNNGAYVDFKNTINLDSWISTGCKEKLYIFYNSDYSFIVFAETADGKYAYNGPTGNQTNKSVGIDLSYNSKKGQIYEVSITGENGTYNKRYSLYVGEKVPEPLESETGLAAFVDGKKLCWQSQEGNCWDFNDPVNSDLILNSVYLTYYDGMSSEEHLNENFDIGFTEIGDKEVLCNGHSIPYGIPYIIYRVINIIKILTPIVLIILGMIDFAKSVIAGNEDEMKKSQAKFINRIIAGIIVFFVIAIVQFLFNILGDNDVFSCFSCFVSGEDCNIVDVTEE